MSSIPCSPKSWMWPRSSGNSATQLSFYGGISTQRTLPFGTVQETRDEVRRLIDVLGRDGGYIASPPTRSRPMPDRKTSPP